MFYYSNKTIKLHSSAKSPNCMRACTVQTLLIIRLVLKENCFHYELFHLYLCRILNKYLHSFSACMLIVWEKGGGRVKKRGEGSTRVTLAALFQSHMCYEKSNGFHSNDVCVCARAIVMITTISLFTYRKWHNRVTSW